MLITNSRLIDLGLTNIQLSPLSLRYSSITSYFLIKVFIFIFMYQRRYNPGTVYVLVVWIILFVLVFFGAKVYPHKSNL